MGNNRESLSKVLFTHFEKDQLEVMYGGSNEFKFDYDSYDGSGTTIPRHFLRDIFPLKEIPPVTVQGETNDIAFRETDNGAN